LSNNLVRFLKNAGVVVLIGMGNDLRADDAVGLHVVRRLKSFSSSRLRVFEGQMTPEVYIGQTCAAHPTLVVIIDAAEIGEKPGMWQVLGPEKIEQGLFTTHSIPAVEVAAEIKRRCGAEVVFVGIQPRSREVSIGLSLDCQKAVVEIVEVIRQTLTLS
jgi:hydrogenase 3 maturation protease